MALREPGLVSAEDHRHMSKFWNRIAEGLVQEDLSRCIVDMIVAAQDQSHPHLGIVNHDDKVVSRGIVGALDDEIVELFVLERDRPFDAVDKGGLAIRDEKANGVRTIVGLILAMQAGAVVFRLAAALHGRVAALLQLFRRAVTTIGLAGGDQLLHLAPVQVETVGLVNRPFVVTETEPVHGLQNRIDGGLGAAGDIGVFNPQNEFSLLLAGEEKIKEGGAGAANMEIAGGAGGKTNT